MSHDMYNCCWSFLSHNEYTTSYKQNVMCTCLSSGIFIPMLVMYNNTLLTYPDIKYDSMWETAFRLFNSDFQARNGNNNVI